MRFIFLIILVVSEIGCSQDIDNYEARKLHTIDMAKEGRFHLLSEAAIDDISEASKNDLAIPVILDPKIILSGNKYLVDVPFMQNAPTVTAIYFRCDSQEDFLFYLDDELIEINNNDAETMILMSVTFIAHADAPLYRWINRSLSDDCMIRVSVAYDGELVTSAEPVRILSD
jgi:hypothetical protein